MISFVLIILMSDLFVLFLNTPLASIQFPWRLLGITTTLLFFASVIFFIETKHHKILKSLFITFIFLASYSSISYYGEMSFVYPTVTNENYQDYYRLGNAKYLPAGTFEYYAKNLNNPNLRYEWMESIDQCSSYEFDYNTIKCDYYSETNEVI